MSSRRNFLIGVISLWAVQWSKRAAHAGDWLTRIGGRHRPKALCGVPAADYQHRARTQSVVVRTLPAVSTGSANNVEETLRLLRMKRQIALDSDGKLGSLFSGPQLPTGLEGSTPRAIDKLGQPQTQQFRLASSTLQIGYVQVSGFSLETRRSGDWVVSYKASVSSGGNSSRGSNVQVKRSAIRLHVRLLRSSIPSRSLFGLGDSERSALQVLEELSVPEEWVQRDETKSVVHQGHSEKLESDFDVIQQAELEFYYYLDPLTRSGEGVMPTPVQ